MYVHVFRYHIAVAYTAFQDNRLSELLHLQNDFPTSFCLGGFCVHVIKCCHLISLLYVDILHFSALLVVY